MKMKECSCKRDNIGDIAGDDVHGFLATKESIMVVLGRDAW